MKVLTPARLAATSAGVVCVAAACLGLAGCGTQSAAPNDSATGPALATTNSSGAQSGADERYLAEVAARHASFGSPVAAISAARTACQGIRDNLPPVDVSSSFVAAANTQSAADGAMLFLTAVEIYCPDLQTKLVVNSK